MDKQTLDQVDAELIEIIRIEQAIKYSLLTTGDVISLIELELKGIPGAEFLYGVYMLLDRRKYAVGYLWFIRCKKHCNDIYLRKIDYIDKMIFMRRIY